MPYIDRSRRMFPSLGNNEDVGELTYNLTRWVLMYLGKTPDYQRFAEVLGAIEATKLELYRRSVALYEDKKIQDNGDLEYPYG